MKILHLLRSEPDELTRAFISESYPDEENKEVPLYSGPIDYDRLLEDIFAHDRIICWW